MSVRRARPPSPPRADTTVPDLLGRNVAQVDSLAGAAGVVAVLSYRPRARQAPGTVVATHPAAGSAVPRGSTVRVSVAGRRHRVVACDSTLAELESVRDAVTAALLRAGGITVRVDRAACRVRVSGDVPAEVAAALTESYGRAVVVERGHAAAHTR